MKLHAVGCRPCVQVRAAHGFTLTEMLIVVALASILALIAVPSLQAALRNNRLDTVSNQFVAALAMARSEAVKQGIQINVSSAAGTNWGAPGGTGTSWAICCTPGTAANLQNGEPMTTPMTLYGSAATAAGFGFSPMGRLVVSGTVPPPSLVFVFCADGVALANGSRAVLVSPSGRVSLAHIPAPGSTVGTPGIPLKDGGTSVASCTAP